LTGGDGNKEQKQRALSLDYCKLARKSLKREQSTGGDSNISKLQWQNGNVYYYY